VVKKKHLGVFIGAVWGHWEARFGTTFAVILAVGQYCVLEFADPQRVPPWAKWIKDFPPSVWLSVGAVMLFWACYAAWHEERTNTVKAEENLKIAGDRLADRTPRIAFRVTSACGNELRSLENCIPPPVFNLLHHSGDGARFVNVGPILSPNGRQLIFEIVNVVAPPVQVSLPFSVRFEDGSKGPRKDNWDTSMSALIDFFLADHLEGASEHIYEVPIWFEWNGINNRDNSCRLRYSYPERKFTVLPRTEA